MSKIKVELIYNASIYDITKEIINISELVMKVESERAGMCGAIAYDSITLTVAYTDTIKDTLYEALVTNNKLFCNIKYNDKLIYAGLVDITEIQDEIIKNNTVTTITKISFKAIDRLRAIELFGNPAMRYKASWSSYFSDLPSGYQLITTKNGDWLHIDYVGPMATGVDMYIPKVRAGQIVMLETGNAFFCLWSRVIRVGNSDGESWDITECKGIFNCDKWDKVTNTDIVRNFAPGRYVYDLNIYGEDCYSYKNITFDNNTYECVDKIDVYKLLKAYVKQLFPNYTYSFPNETFYLPVDYWTETLGNAFFGKSNYEFFKFLLDTVNCYAFFKENTLHIVKKTALSSRTTINIDLDKIKNLRYKYFWDKIADETQVTVTANIIEYQGRMKIQTYNGVDLKENYIFVRQNGTGKRHLVTQNTDDGWYYFVGLDDGLDVIVNNFIDFQAYAGGEVYSAKVTAYENLGTKNTLYKTTGITHKIIGQKAKNTVRIETLANADIVHTRASLDNYANQRALELFNFYGKRHDSYEMTIIKKNEENFDYSLLDNVIVDGRKYFIAQINYNIIEELIRLQVISVDAYDYNPNVATIPNVNQSTGQVQSASATGGGVYAGIQITQSQIDNWDYSASIAHIHNNKTLLDAINQNLSTEADVIFKSIISNNAISIMNNSFEGVALEAIYGKLRLGVDDIKGAYLQYLDIDDQTDYYLYANGFLRTAGNLGNNLYTIWHSGNDGAGSGLDADMLDGLHSDAFLQKGINNVNNQFELIKSYNNRIGFNLHGTIISGVQTNGGLQLTGLFTVIGANYYYDGADRFISNGSPAIVLRLFQGDLQVFKSTNTPVAGNIISFAGPYKVWHSGNMGSGSGLDADLLDGYHASAFPRLDTVNTFTKQNIFTELIDAIGNIRTSGYIYHSSTDYVSQGFKLEASKQWFSRIEAENLVVKRFTTELEQIYAGLLTVGESAGKTTIAQPIESHIKRIAMLDGTTSAQFTVNDIIMFQYYNRSGGGVTVLREYFRVTDVASNPATGGTDYTVTRLTNNIPNGTSIPAGSVVIKVANYNGTISSNVTLDAIKGSIDISSVRWNNGLTKDIIFKAGDLAGLVFNGTALTGKGLYIAGNAYITAKINATEGKIGGWWIDGANIYYRQLLESASGGVIESYLETKLTITDGGKFQVIYVEYDSGMLSTIINLIQVGSNIWGSGSNGIGIKNMMGQTLLQILDRGQSYIAGFKFDSGKLWSGNGNFGDFDTPIWMNSATSGNIFSITDLFKVVRGDKLNDNRYVQIGGDDQCLKVITNLFDGTLIRLIGSGTITLKPQYSTNWGNYLEINGPDISSSAGIYVNSVYLSSTGNYYSSYGNAGISGQWTVKDVTGNYKTFVFQNGLLVSVS